MTLSDYLHTVKHGELAHEIPDEMVKELQNHEWLRAAINGMVALKDKQKPHEIIAAALIITFYEGYKFAKQEDK